MSIIARSRREIDHPQIDVEEKYGDVKINQPQERLKMVMDNIGRQRLHGKKTYVGLTLLK